MMIVTEYMENGALDIYLRVRTIPLLRALNALLNKALNLS